MIRSACLTGYDDLVRSVGLDPARLLRGVGLDPACLLNPDTKIPSDAVTALHENPAVNTWLPDLGLRLAESRRLSNLGPIALAIRDAATVREALEINNRYLPLHNEAMTLSFEPAGDSIILKIDIMADARQPGRQRVELAVAVTHRVVRQLSGTRWRALQVWFAHSAPKNLASYLRVFGPWVEFGRDCNGLVFDAEHLDATLDSSDPAMVAHVKQYLDPLLEQVSLPLAEKTKRLVQDLLISRRASADLVAAGLGVSRRTLHRQLAQDGTTFSSILDDVRMDLARRYIADSGLSLSDVAHRLGFSELSGFSRWFRSEFDCSPLAWRSTELAQNQLTAGTVD
jgi:AraC-like DNA-binding protein